MSVTSDVSRSVSPAISDRSIATVSSENELSEFQEKVLATTRRICDGNSHPFDKLTKLYSARVIKHVVTEDSPQNGDNSVRVSVNANDDVQFEASARCTSKKQAKKEAAQEVLALVYEYLVAHPPHHLFDVVASVRKQQGPTASEVKVMAEDQHHLRILESMLKDKEEFVTRVISVDLEQWECNHTIPLEFGISYKVLGQPLNSLHWIVEDNEHLSNGRYCPDNRNNFVFGMSEKVREAHLKRRFDDLLAELVSGCEKVYFVGHTVQSDLKWLKDMDISLPASFVACDVGKAHRALTSPDEYANMMGMERLMDALEIDHPYMHNAGNDAYYNIRVLENLLRTLSEKTISRM